ncbi:hypothetical protein GS504_00980 [Rhodococcus hoagii]|nr:hypothetical protein [Prescottella equi]
MPDRESHCAPCESKPSSRTLPCSGRSAPSPRRTTPTPTPSPTRTGSYGSTSTGSTTSKADTGYSPRYRTTDERPESSRERC